MAWCLRSWMEGEERDSDSQTKEHKHTDKKTKRQRLKKIRLTLASIRKPVKLLRICSILSPESSTDSASRRWRSPSTLNHCCICRVRSFKTVLMLFIFLLYYIKSQHMIYYQGWHVTKWTFHLCVLALHEVQCEELVEEVGPSLFHLLLFMLITCSPM